MLQTFCFTRVVHHLETNSQNMEKGVGFYKTVFKDVFLKVDRFEGREDILRKKSLYNRVLLSVSTKKSLCCFPANRFEAFVRI